ncbi:MAG TPA: YIP1 family protein [Gammaproteobacteria bacterium]|nr:YIP1 family protein [Gammaproteobacteria bacterium]
MSTSASALAALINIFLEPKKAMEDTRGHVGWLWYPLIIMLVVGTGFQLWYLHVVDFNWFVDQTLAPKAADMTADQLRTARERMTPGSFSFFAVLFSTVGVLIWYAIQALYFFMVAKLGGYKDQAFGHWFSFICWTSLVGLLGFIASGVFLLTAKNGQISPVAIDVTSLNTLLFHVDFGHKGQALLSSLRLTTFWSWGLMAVGLSQWTGKSLGRAAAIVILPYAVCYLIWALIAFL